MVLPTWQAVTSLQVGSEFVEGWRCIVWFWHWNRSSGFPAGSASAGQNLPSSVRVILRKKTAIDHALYTLSCCSPCKWMLIRRNQGMGSFDSTTGIRKWWMGWCYFFEIEPLLANSTAFILLWVWNPPHQMPAPVKRSPVDCQNAFFKKYYCFFALCLTWSYFIAEACGTVV